MILVGEQLTEMHGDALDKILSNSDIKYTEVVWNYVWDPIHALIDESVALLIHINI
jgi:hypothetical protein